MNEWEKMMKGMWYDANHDAKLIGQRIMAKDLCFELNNTKPSDDKKRQEVIQRLLHQLPEGLELISPFMCDYGKNIHFGKNVFVNSGCYFMDCASITIQDHCFIGPSCGFYTANHPLDAKERNLGLEQALPILIEENVWIGANVTVLPGVRIGRGSVIAAGSVVTKSIGCESLAAGVPCRVIRKINDCDQIGHLFNADYHVHTHFSDDSDYVMEEVVKDAVKKRNR